MKQLNLTHCPQSMALLCFSLWSFGFPSLAMANEDRANGNPMDAETALSIEIVNRYRELRSSCNDQKDEARKMCYYRLRIGLWDYQQARETLSQKGIHLQTPTQVADAH